MPRTAVAIRHVHFEDLGTFEEILARSGYELRYHDIGVHDLGTIAPTKTDLLVVLGGPVGVNDGEAFPFLAEERQLLEARLAADRPTLGICLGAQLIAAALKARVFASDVKEIGLLPVTLSEAGRSGPLKHLAEVPVLHWHGDTFEIPKGAQRLASTETCRNQAFALGTNVLGVQFHPEVDLSSRFERWLVGHAFELAAARIDPASLRAQAREVDTTLRNAACRAFGEWIEQLRQ